ncbi:MAG: hypothetical protein WC835_00915 [Candidatus Paceibacterota bacterium]
MDDENIIPPQEIIDLPEIGKDENIGGISFVQEPPLQNITTTNIASVATPITPAEPIKIIPPSVIPPIVPSPEVKPPNIIAPAEAVPAPQVPDTTPAVPTVAVPVTAPPQFVQPPITVVSTEPPKAAAAIPETSAIKLPEPIKIIPPSVIPPIVPSPEVKPPAAAAQAEPPQTINPEPKINAIPQTETPKIIPSATIPSPSPAPEATSSAAAAPAKTALSAPTFFSTTLPIINATAVAAPPQFVQPNIAETKTEPAQATAVKEAVSDTRPIARPEPLKMPGSYKPEPEEDPPSEASNLKAIRTYQADVAESVKGQKTSLVRMVVAEQARKQQILELESPRNKWNIVFIVAGFAMLLSGTVAAIVVFNKYKQTGTIVGQPPAVVQSFIFAENGKVIPTAGQQTEVITKTIAKEVKSANNKLDTIENISLTENTGDGETPLTTQRLFYFLDNRMPPSLLRSLDEDFMLGVHTFNGNHPFIILKTNFYENTFAGMLGWEQYMARDLLPVFAVEKNPDSQVFTKSFEDRTLKNRDTRVLTDDNGSTLLLYTFKDKETLIITTSGDTMEEVIRRLNSSGPIGR